MRSVPWLSTVWLSITLAALPIEGTIEESIQGAIQGQEECGSPLFEEASKARGVEFRHDAGISEARHLPESMGAGAVWFDYDNDGWQDLYLVQSGVFPPDDSSRSQNQLFRNTGAGRFEDVSLRSSSNDPGYGQGAVAGDLDGDGNLDLVVTNFGTDKVLRNRGDGTFEASLLPASENWSASAALADVDSDGDLDLYVTSYVIYDLQEVPRCSAEGSSSARYCDPSIFQGATDRFYKNDGTGKFILQSPSDEQGPEARGLDGRGLGVMMVDLNEDLAPDIYVANDLTPNVLWINDGLGRFSEESLFSGLAVNGQGRSEAGMGLAVADIDGDRDPDVAVTNFDVETNTLYQNDGAAQFRDLSSRSGFGPPSLNYLGFGLVSTDLDLDGDPDFVVANGHIFDPPKRDNTSYAQSAQALINSQGSFSIDPCALPSGALVGRGLARGDLDNDGDDDLLFQQNDRLARLFVRTGTPSSFLGLDLAEKGVGAVSSVSTGGQDTSDPSDQDGRVQSHWHLAGDSYLSGSEGRVSFHWPASESAQWLEVVWPNGVRQRLQAPPLNFYLTLPKEPSPGSAR